MTLLLSALLASLITPLTALSGLLTLAGASLALIRTHALSARPGAMSFIMLGWLFWIPLSLFWSLSPGTALTYAAVLLCLPLTWMTAAAARGRTADILAWLLPALLAIMTAWAVLQGPGTFTAKPQGPFNDPNLFAAFLNLLILPILARWLASDPVETHPAWRTLQLALLSGGLFASFLISSRGGMLALLAMAGLLLWQARSLPHARRHYWLLLAVFAAAFAAAHYATMGLNVVQRLASTVTEGDAPRIMLLKSALSMIADHPWLGTGIGSFQLLYAQYRAADETGSAGAWVHNDYLQFWQEAGLPMFLLLIALLLWVTLRCRTLLKGGDPGTLKNLGYLVAVGAVLLHAAVNFLLYFAPVMLLMGMYLALATPSDDGGVHPRLAGAGDFGKYGLVVDPSSRHFRAFRIAAIGYGVIVGYLLFGQVAVEYLLGDGQYAQRLSAKMQFVYPRSEVAYWLSVMAPFNPTPQQVQAFDTADAMVMAGGGTEMLDEALSRMEISIQLVPCYQPFANAALAMLVKEKLSADLIARGERIVAASLACAPRHGLTYYYSGILESMHTGGDPLQKWIKGLTMTRSYGEQLMLATAIMVVTQPQQEKVLIPLVKQMAQDIKLRESRPGVLPEQYFWVEAQRKLHDCCGPQHLELINAAQRVAAGYRGPGK